MLEDPASRPQPRIAPHFLLVFARARKGRHFEGGLQAALKAKIFAPWCNSSRWSAPQLHHLAALHHELCAIVGSAQRAALPVRELRFDHLGLDVHLFDHDGARHHAEAMRHHLGVVEADAS